MSATCGHRGDLGHGPCEKPEGHDDDHVADGGMVGWPNNETRAWNAALEQAAKEVESEFLCVNCQSHITIASAIRALKRASRDREGTK